jgi:hypothetical protein
MPKICLRKVELIYNSYYPSIGYEVERAVLTILFIYYVSTSVNCF